MRFSGQQRGIQVGGLTAAARGPAELGAVGSFTLTEQQVIGLALDYLTSGFAMNGTDNSVPNPPSCLMISDNRPENPSVSGSGETPGATVTGGT